MNDRATAFGNESNVSRTQPDAVGEGHAGREKFEVVKPRNRAFAIGAEEISALISGFKRMNLDAELPRRRKLMNRPQQVFCAPLRTGRSEKQFDPAIRRFAQLFMKVFRQPKISLRIGRSRLGRASPSFLSELTRQV